ncbi:MAG: phage holin family protein [Dehalococcoidia bacterium]|nr:phage holin family protein [Dehalococcoidia bacterium]
MEKFFIRWAANAVGLFLAASLLPDPFRISFAAGSTDFFPGQPVPGWAVILIAALILAMVNTFVRPLVKMFTCLINLLTMGLFSIVVNIAMIFVASWVMDKLLGAGFVTFPAGVLAALAAAFVIGVINHVFDRVF